MPAIRGRIGSSVVLAIACLFAGCTESALPTSSLVPASTAVEPTPTVASPAPTNGTPAPTRQPSDSPSSPEEGWLNVAQAPDAYARWSPDAAHLLIAMSTPGGPPESNVVRLVSSGGSTVRDYEAVTDPVWIDGDRFVAYRLEWQQDESGTWFAATGPNGERHATALVGATSSDTLTESDLPTEPALGNGHGALALERFDGASRTEFAIWDSDGLTEWRLGQPMRWSASGDRLAVVHSSDSGPTAEGWLEVVEWPGLSTLRSSDPALRVADAQFDPSGRLLAYAEYVERPTAPRQLLEFDLIVRIVSLDGNETAALTAPENGEFVWLSGDRLLVVGYDSHLASELDLRGAVLGQESVVGPNVIASADGSTSLFYDAELDQPPIQVMRGGDLRLLQSPGMLAGPPPVLAPDGSGLLVVVRLPSSAPQGPPATVLFHGL